MAVDTQAPIERPKGLFGHLDGLLVLFLTEMWERFSFYWMRAMLVKFLIAGSALGGFAVAEADAFQIFSVYNSMAYVAPLVTGWVRQEYGYHPAFALAAVGMTIAVVQYVLGGRRLEGVGLKAYKPIARPELNRLLRIAGVIAGVAAAALLIDIVLGTYRFSHVVTALAFLPLVVAVGYFAMVFRDKSLTKVEHSRVTAYVFIFLGATLFWLIYDQAGSVLTGFAD